MIRWIVDPFFEEIIKSVIDANSNSLESRRARAILQHPDDNAHSNVGSDIEMNRDTQNIKVYLRLENDKRSAGIGGTSNTYDPYQKKFFKFCEERFAGEPGYKKATDIKLLAYLNDQTGMRNNHTTKPPPKISTVTKIIKAVGDLYVQQQKILKILNPDFERWPDPRSQRIKDFKSQYPFNTGESNGEVFHQSPNLKELLDTEDYKKLVLFAMQNSTVKKSYFKTMAAMLLSYHMMFKSESLKRLEFIDLRYHPHYIEIKNDSWNCVKDYIPNYFTTSQDKENKSNLNNYEKECLKQMREETTGTDKMVYLSTETENNKENYQSVRETRASIRHNDVLLCDHFWVAAYLIERFHINKEPPIDFSKRENFVNLKVFPNAQNRNAEWDFNLLYQDYTLLLKEIGIKCSMVAYMPRKSGFQECVNKNGKLEAIRNFGDFAGGNEYVNTQSFKQKCTDTVPNEPVLILAGAEKINGDFVYSMDRNLVEPPETLKQQIFPWINEILNTFDRESLNKQPKTEKEREQQITDQLMFTLVQTLDYLRTVFLQDFKFLEDRFLDGIIRDHDLFQIPVLKSPEYDEFRVKQNDFYKRFHAMLNDKVHTWGNDKGLVSVSNSLSEEKTMSIAETLNPNSEVINLKAEVIDLKAEVIDLKAEVIDLTAEVINSKAEVINSKAEVINLKAEVINLKAEVIDLKSGMHNLEKSMESNFSSMVSFLQAQSMNGYASTNGGVSDAEPFASNESTEQGNENMEEEKEEEVIPPFNFIPQPTSYEVIWAEYNESRAGSHSIKEMEKRYRNRWRKDKGVERKFFRRKTIWNAIKRGIARKYTVEQCCELLRRSQKELGKSISDMMESPHYLPAELKNEKASKKLDG